MLRTLSFVLGLCLVGFISESRASIDDGLIGYWPLDGDALDHSGNGNDGTVLTGASFVANPTGEGGVLQSDGGGVGHGHVELTLPKAYRPADDVNNFEGSGAFWVMFDDRVPMEIGVNVQGVIGQIPGILYIERVMDSNRLRVMIRRRKTDGTTKNHWPLSATQSVAEEHVWYHVAWTFRSCDVNGENGFFRWYVNGELSSEYTGSLLTHYSTVFKMGASHGGYANNTKIAEVRLYDRILSEDEVWQLARQEGFSPLANYPTWWEQYGVVNPQTYPDDYAPVNQGQLKHVATQATNYMDDELVSLGGAGTEVHQLVDAWSTTTAQTNNYAMTNQGQLKFVASHFHDRLRAIGFDAWPEGMSIDPDTGYPWTQVADDDANFSPANLGQLKFLFSWDLRTFDVYSADTDENGILDWWEFQYFDHTGVDPNADLDEDDLTNMQEYLTGGNPGLGDSNSDGMSDLNRYFAGLNLSQISLGGGLCILSVLE